MSEPIRHELVLAAARGRVFELLTSADEFTAVTGAPAAIGASDGGRFSCFGGLIEGRNVELVPGARSARARSSRGLTVDLPVLTASTRSVSAARNELMPCDLLRGNRCTIRELRIAAIRRDLACLPMTTRPPPLGLDSGSVLELVAFESPPNTLGCVCQTETGLDLPASGRTPRAPGRSGQR
jgi:hypothetical protein